MGASNFDEPSENPWFRIVWIREKVELPSADCPVAMITAGDQLFAQEAVNADSALVPSRCALEVTMAHPSFADWRQRWSPSQQFWFVVAAILGLSGAVCLVIGAAAPG